MNYEKAYKAVLKTATQWIKDGCTDKERICLESVFPELRESEDEKIRKAILGLTYLDGIEPILTKCSITAGDIRAWLEKQKEQNPVEYLNKDKVYAIMKKLHDLAFSQRIPIDSDEYKKIGEITSDVRSLLDYPIEQKPAQTDDEREYVKTLKGLVSDFVRDSQGGITDVGYYQRICDWLDGRNIEQKPVEKQDYSGLTDLERAIHRGFLSAGVENAPLTIIKETAQECLAQMKPAEWSEKHIADIFEKVGLAKIVREQGNDALTNAVQSAMIELSKTNTAEWSEEDEEMLEQAIRCVNNSGKLEVSTEEIEDWLKSLHSQSKIHYWTEEEIEPIISDHQSHWKPSEEQMKALLKVVDKARELHYSSNSGYDEYDVLRSLYKQLNQL